MSISFPILPCDLIRHFVQEKLQAKNTTQRLDFANFGGTVSRGKVIVIPNLEQQSGRLQAFRSNVHPILDRSIVSTAIHFSSIEFVMPKKSGSSEKKPADRKSAGGAKGSQKADESTEKSKVSIFSCGHPGSFHY